jgi:hypothetical protein
MSSWHVMLRRKYPLYLNTSGKGRRVRERCRAVALSSFGDPPCGTPEVPARQGRQPAMRGNTLANSRDDSNEHWQVAATLLAFTLLLACVIVGLVFFGLLGIIVFSLAILVGVAFYLQRNPL